MSQNKFCNLYNISLSTFFGRNEGGYDTNTN